MSFLKLLAPAARCTSCWVLETCTNERVARSVLLWLCPGFFSLFLQQADLVPGLLHHAQWITLQPCQGSSPWHSHLLSELPSTFIPKGFPLCYLLPSLSSAWVLKPDPLSLGGQIWHWQGQGGFVVSLVSCPLVPAHTCAGDEGLSFSDLPLLLLSFEAHACFARSFSSWFVLGFGVQCMILCPWRYCCPVWPCSHELVRFQFKSQFTSSVN